MRTAHGQWLEREGLIVRLETEDKLVGWGEIAPITDFGTESFVEAKEACVALGNIVTSQAIESIDPKNVCVKSALRSALHEIYRLKAEANQEASLTKATHIPDSLTVAGLLPAGIASFQAAKIKSEQGFRTFKWKVGVAAYKEELAMLDDLLAKLPDGSKLRLDANEAWDQPTLEKWLAVTAERPIEYIEQPLSRKSKNLQDVLLHIQNDYPTPIALDESICNDHDVSEWINSEWQGIYVIKPTLFADPYRVVNALALSNANVVFSSALETAIGAKAALHLAFRWSGEMRALGFGVWPLFKDFTFDGPIAHPFLMRKDVESINPESLWNALN